MNKPQVHTVFQSRRVTAGPAYPIPVVVTSTHAILPQTMAVIAAMASKGTL